MNKLALAVAAAALIAAGHGAFAADTTATYTVTFDGTWSAATHPLDYPPGAHFSGLIGATHDDRYVLFRAGGTATAGLERLAEMGEHTPLDGEIRAAIAAGAAGTLIEARPIFGPPGSATATFTIDSGHPMVSLVAMVAPSPDWFGGVAGVDLREGAGWVSRKAMTVYAWDAGTDSGTTYRADDIDTQPRGAIMLNAAPHFMQNGQLVPVGTLVFEKTGEKSARLSPQ